MVHRRTRSVCSVFLPLFSLHLPHVVCLPFWPLKLFPPFVLLTRCPTRPLPTHTLRLLLPAWLRLRSAHVMRLSFAVLLRDPCAYCYTVLLPCRLGNHCFAPPFLDGRYFNLLPFCLLRPLHACSDGDPWLYRSAFPWQLRWTGAPFLLASPHCLFPRGHIRPRPSRSVFGLYFCTSVRVFLVVGHCSSSALRACLRCFSPRAVALPIVYCAVSLSTAAPGLNSAHSPRIPSLLVVLVLRPLARLALSCFPLTALPPPPFLVYSPIIPSMRLRAPFFAAHFFRGFAVSTHAGLNLSLWFYWFYPPPRTAF